MTYPIEVQGNFLLKNIFVKNRLCNYVMNHKSAFFCPTGKDGRQPEQLELSTGKFS